VCNSSDGRFRFQKRGHSIVRCGACNLHYYPWEPAEDDIDRLYGETYFMDGGDGYPDYVADEAAHRKQARRYLRRLRRVGVQTGSLLDVGCAAGFFLDEARRAGWDVIGCDVSAYACRHAERLGLDVLRATFAAAPLPARFFDVVTMFNTFEHLPRPREVVARVESLLRPGGVFVFETWDRDALVARLLRQRWPQYSPPSVLHYFARRDLERLLEPSHWEWVAYGSAAKWLSVRHGLSLLDHQLQDTLLAGPCGRIARSVPASLSVPYRLGDLVFGICQLRK